MNLQNILSLPCTIRYVIDALEVQSGAARRMLLEREMMTDEKQIGAYYDELKQYVACVSDKKMTVQVKNLQFRLQGLKDIRTTLANLQEGRVLDDIELFEIKHLAMLACEVKKQTDELQLGNSLCVLEEVVSMLDPEGLRIATFYIYDAYSERLRDLRRCLQQTPNDDTLFSAAQDEEERVRRELSSALRPYAKRLQETFTEIGRIDIFLAQAMQVLLWNLTLPVLASETEYVGMWNPEVREILKKKGREYQCNSIRFGLSPCLITGSNMGGKTVVLKTVALCQYLVQFGFGIPALEARVAVKDDIRLCMADGQSVESGLSSFAAEMRSLDAVLRSARTDTRLLALIDEPARTTNPVEGTALVTGLIEVLRRTGQSVLMVTHYTVNAGDCRCYRVSGLHDGQMDYSLIPTTADDVPHEALLIAEQLGIDDEWLSITKQQLEKL